MKRVVSLTFLIFLFMAFSQETYSQTSRLYTGRFTGAGEKGFNVFDMNIKDGSLTLFAEADAGANPSYFCVSRKHRLIYAANEVMNFKGSKGGGITTLKFDEKSGTSTIVSEIVIPNGSPCFISLSTNDEYLLLANYTGGSAAVVKLDNKGIPVGISDSISFSAGDGKASHAHMIAPGPEGKRIYLTDLGLDQIIIFDLDSSGKLKQLSDGVVKVPKGSGPRHFVFNSSGTKMYVICELNSTVLVFDVAGNGDLNLIQTVSTLKDGFTGKNACADIHIGVDGRFLYGSNRGENSIVTFKIETDGKLIKSGTTTCGGNWPRNFVVDPSGKFLLVGNQRSGNISVFSIDRETGLPVEPAPEYKLTAPACLKF